jgi:hypothetical protein
MPSGTVYLQYASREASKMCTNIRFTDSRARCPSQASRTCRGSPAQPFARPVEVQADVQDARPGEDRVRRRQTNGVRDQTGRNAHGESATVQNLPPPLWRTEGHVLLPEVLLGDLELQNFVRRVFYPIHLYAAAASSPKMTPHGMDTRLSNVLVNCEQSEVAQHLPTLLCMQAGIRRCRQRLTPDRAEHKRRGDLRH